MSMDGVAGSGGDAADPPGKPVRNMDDIARLFLAGARDVAENAGETAEEPVTPVVQTPATHATTRTGDPPLSAPPSRDPPVALVAMTPLAGEAGWAAILSAAAHLAGEWGSGVAIVGMHAGKMKLMRAGTPRFGTVAVAGCGGPDLDVQLARTLFGMRENVAHWIVALPMGRSMDHVLAAVREWLLVCGTDNESIVSGYRILKNVVAGDPLDEPRATRLFLSCEDYAQAAVVHARLRRAAREFLQQDLPLSGVSGHAPAEVQTIAEFDVDADDSAAWSSVAEFLHDLLGNTASDDDTVLDEAAGEVQTAPAEAAPAAPSPAVMWPEMQDTADRPTGDPMHEGAANLPPLALTSQRWNDLWHPPGQMPSADLAASLTASDVTSKALEQIAETADAIAETHDAPPADAAVPERVEAASASVEPVSERGETQSATPVTSAAASVLASVPMLRAVEVASISDEARWNAVEVSAADLCQAEQIEARPPGTPRAGLWLDRDGRFHLWVLSDGGSGWISLWQWAREHRAILALTRKDRWVDTIADVRIHVVVPSELPIKPVDLPGVCWYRLTLVRWAERAAAVVVPA